MTVLNLSERRRRRSEETYTAIRYQLEHVHEKLGLDNFVLGDENGLVLAHAGEEDDAAILAAFAPVLGRHVDRDERSKVMEKIDGFLPGTNSDSVTIRKFVADGQQFLLCVKGQEKVAREAGIYRAVTGIRRILGKTAFAA